MRENSSFSYRTTFSLSETKTIVFLFSVIFFYNRIRISQVNKQRERTIKHRKRRKTTNRDIHAPCRELRIEWKQKKIENDEERKKCHWFFSTNFHFFGKLLLLDASVWMGNIITGWTEVAVTTLYLPSLIDCCRDFGRNWLEERERRELIVFGFWRIVSRVGTGDVDAIIRLYWW